MAGLEPGWAIPWLMVALAGCGATSPGSDPAKNLEVIPAAGLGSAEAAVIKQLQDERQAVEELLAESPDSPDLADAFGRLGRFYHAYDLLAPAAVCYRNAHRLDPEEVRWLYHLSTLYKRQGRLEEAAETLASALALRSTDAPALLLMGQILLSQHEPARAETFFQRALEADPRCTAARYGLGEAARAGGRLSEAVEHYRRTLSDQTLAVRVHYPLAQALLRLDRVEEAQSHLRMVEARRVNFGGKASCPSPLDEELAGLTTGVAAHLARGATAGYQGAFQVEIEEYRKAVRLGPDDAVAHHSLGAALYRHRELAGAADEFRRAIELNPRNPAYHHDLAQALLRMKSLDAAESAFAAAVELDAKYSSALLKLAEMNLTRKDNAAARRYATRVLEIDAADWKARTVLAMSLLGLNRRVQALDEIRTVLERYPPQDPAEYLALEGLLVQLDGSQDAERSEPTPE